MTFTESFLEAEVGEDSQLDAEFHFIVRIPSLLLSGVFFLFFSPSRPPTHPSSVYISAGLFVIPLVSPDRILCPSTIRAEPLTSGPLSPSPYLPTNACRSPFVHFSLFAFARCQTGSRVVVLQGHIFK